MAKAGVVGGGREQATAAGNPGRFASNAAYHHLSLAGCWINLRFGGASGIDRAKGRVGEAERFADAFGDETIEFHSAHKLYDAAEDVGGHAVLESCAGLVRERQSCEPRYHLGIGVTFVADTLRQVGFLEKR